MRVTAGSAGLQGVIHLVPVLAAELRFLAAESRRMTCLICVLECMRICWQLQCERAAAPNRVTASLSHWRCQQVLVHFQIWMQHIWALSTGCHKRAIQTAK